jgi:hypothetical protein
MVQHIIAELSVAILGAARRRNRRRKRLGKRRLELDVSFYLADPEDEEGLEVSPEEFLSAREYAEPFISVEFGGRLFAVHGSLPLGQVTLDPMWENEQPTVDLCQPAGRDQFREWLAGRGLPLTEARLAKLGDRLRERPESRELGDLLHEWHELHRRGLPLGKAWLAKLGDLRRERPESRELADQIHELHELVKASREEADHCPTCGMEGEKIGDAHVHGQLHNYQCPLGHIWGTRL